MYNEIRAQSVEIGNHVQHFYAAHIFPEYPYIGVIVAVLAVITFIYHLVRSGVVEGLMAGLAIFVGLTVSLFIVHWLNTFFHFM